MATITFTCKGCKQVLRVGADKAGKKVRCSRCQTVVTIPEDEETAIKAEPATGRDKRPVREEEDEEPLRRRAVADDDDEEPPRRRPRDDEDEEEEEPPRRRTRDEDDEEEEDRPRKVRRSEWGPKVKNGLAYAAAAAGMVSAYGFLLFLGLLLLLALIPLAIFSPEMAIFLLYAIRAMFYLAIVCHIGFHIPAVIGYVYCMLAPNKHGSFGLALTGLVFGIIALILKIVFQVIPLFGGELGGDNQGGPMMMIVPDMGMAADTLPMMLMLACLLIWISDAEFLVFSLYLRSLGMIIKDQELSRGWSFPFTLSLVATTVRMFFLVFIFLLVIKEILLKRPITPGQAIGTFLFLYGFAVLTFGIIGGFGLSYLKYILGGRRAI